LVILRERGYQTVFENEVAQVLRLSDQEPITRLIR
jgi:hypothetical protein